MSHDVSAGHFLNSQGSNGSRRETGSTFLPGALNQRSSDAEANPQIIVFTKPRHWAPPRATLACLLLPCHSPRNYTFSSKRRLHLRFSYQQSVHSDPPPPFPFPLLDTRPVSSPPIWSPDCKSCSFSVGAHFVSLSPNVLLNTLFKHRQRLSLTI